MNKFAKYVPEEDKKKQREFIGAMGIDDLPFGEEVIDILGEVYDSGTPEDDVNANDLNGFWWRTSIPVTMDNIATVLAGVNINVTIRDDVYENLPLVFNDNYYNSCPGWETPLTKNDFFDQAYEDDPAHKFALAISYDDHIETAYVNIDFIRRYYPGLTPDEVKITRSVVKTIDPKYLPEALQFGETNSFEALPKTTYVVAADTELHHISDHTDARIIEAIKNGAPITLCVNADDNAIVIEPSNIEVDDLFGLSCEFAPGAYLIYADSAIEDTPPTPAGWSIMMSSLTPGDEIWFKVTIGPTVKTLDPKYLPELIIDATDLPSRTSEWSELYQKINDAWNSGTRIRLDIYGSREILLDCVSVRDEYSLFMHAATDSLKVYRLTVYASDGGQFDKFTIPMTTAIG